MRVDHIVQRDGRDVTALNGNTYSDVSDPRSSVLDSQAIFAQELSAKSPEARRALIEAVHRTHDGRDKLLVEPPSGRLLLVWAEAFLTGDGNIKLIKIGDRISVGAQAGPVIARFDHAAPPPTAGWSGWASDIWERVRFSSPEMLPSSLLERLGITQAATRQLEAPPWVTYEKSKDGRSLIATWTGWPGDGKVMTMEWVTTEAFPVGSGKVLLYSATTKTEFEIPFTQDAAGLHVTFPASWPDRNKQFYQMTIVPGP
jgi:hypothetical protein